ncbi:MAG: hypothetical protein JSV01_03895 [Desulfobacterales bacterium]|nr:MAG: hypothetical protein JSV01_03895 [Desulfobacterales bacterium]
MKRMLAAWIAIALLIYPSICIGSYLIELKNGKKFFVSEYWDEGSQVKFPYYGGVVAIQKDHIRTIRESDVPYIEVQPVPVEEPETEPEPAPAQAKPEAEEEAATVPKEETEEAKKLLEEFKVAKERFGAFRYIMTDDELFKFSGELKGLREKIIRKGFYRVYRDQVDEILAMQDEIRVTLDKRRQ